MQNITDLRKSLSENYEAMKDGSMELKVGSELSNVAGKIINSLKVELEYNLKMEYKRKIEYLESSDV